jgi:hypothetical protein
MSGNTYNMLHVGHIDTQWWRFACAHFSPVPHQLYVVTNKIRMHTLAFLAFRTMGCPRAHRDLVYATSERRAISLIETAYSLKQTRIMATAEFALKRLTELGAYFLFSAAPDPFPACGGIPIHKGDISAITDDNGYVFVFDSRVERIRVQDFIKLNGEPCKVDLYGKADPRLTLEFVRALYALDRLFAKMKAQITKEEQALLEMHSRIGYTTNVFKDGPSFLSVCVTGK